MSAGRSLRSEALSDGHDHQQASSCQSEMLFMQHCCDNSTMLTTTVSWSWVQASGPPSTGSVARGLLPVGAIYRPMLTIERRSTNPRAPFFFLFEIALPQLLTARLCQSLS